MPLPDSAPPPQSAYYVKNTARLRKELRKFRACFRSALEGHIPADDLEGVLDDMETAFVRLLPRLPYLGGRKNLLTENLLIAGWFLALFLTLGKRNLPEATLANVAEQAARALVNRRSALRARVQARLVGARWFQWVLEFLSRRSQRRNAAFQLQFLRGDGQDFDFGYDVTRCAIVDLFAAEGVAQLAPLMCKVDYLTSSLAGLELKRTGTIAQGHSHCDFRFVQLRNKHPESNR